jgi:hypothetical protein
MSIFFYIEISNILERITPVFLRYKIGLSQLFLCLIFSNTVKWIVFYKFWIVFDNNALGKPK